MPQRVRQKVAPGLAMRVSGPMEANNTKDASRSELRRSTNPKAAASRASGKRAATKRTAAMKNPELNAQERAERIAIAAYFLAEQRAFAPNHELDDWLAAERSL
jgi:hypothetical protein